MQVQGRKEYGVLSGFMKTKNRRKNFQYDVHLLHFVLLFTYSFEMTLNT
jgi:hypothetical protein